MRNEIVTSADVARSVRLTLDTVEGTYDVQAITAELIATYDLTSRHPAHRLDLIDDAEFWAIVAKHATD
ncbi:hypothetical protein CFN78_06800 [Amycolatopsis antarctica]|uniref:Uncharacterized protein n=1 Tax=Amycolatopsis antarctica TaxID=1854586 RepID=A0A263D6I5_9PSEU|nr:hypothetical protein [Amycolatopsis antarctica]OZM73991.1 hypothetical protein CFN78_06800 [Amycolatopsis antarctica]